jgi:hypothetical protein
VIVGDDGVMVVDATATPVMAKPEIFVFENVPGITSAKDGKILADLKKKINRLHYHLEFKTLMRLTLVCLTLVCFKIGTKLKSIEPWILYLSI